VPQIPEILNLRRASHYEVGPLESPVRLRGGRQKCRSAGGVCGNSWKTLTEDCVVKLRLRDNESISDAVKRFRKLVEHAGIKKEMRRREFYEKPSETSRRSRRRAERRAKIQRMVGNSTGV